MACRGVLIPNKRWAHDLQHPDAGKYEEENLRHIERWTEDLVKNCLGDTDVACIAVAEGNWTYTGSGFGSGNYDPDWSITFQTGGWAEGGAAEILYPSGEEGLYAFNLYMEWFQQPSFTGGVAGTCPGEWYTQVRSLSAADATHLSFTPFVAQADDEPTNSNYFTVGGVIGVSNNESIDVFGGPGFYDFARDGAVGESLWTMAVTLVKISDLIDFIAPE